MRLTMFRSMFVGLLSAVAASVIVSAQGARWEKAVPFKMDQSVTLDAAVGPVKISTLKVMNLGRGYGRGGLVPSGLASEASTTLRFAFDGNNPDEEWEVTFTLELLDKDGKIIDRVTKKESWEEEAKVFNLNHPILEYVVPAISQVRITMQGRLD